MPIEQDLKLYKKKNELDSLPVKIHNQMARTIGRFENHEQAKLFLISMACLLKSENNVAHINKLELWDKLDIKDEQKHTRYFKMFKKMAEKTSYDITLDEDTQIAGNIVYRVKRTRNEYLIAFDDEMTPILKKLNGQYTMYYIDSIMSFKSSCSISLYNYLISWYDDNYVVNKRWFSTEELKDLFGLEKTDYMNKASGNFDRFNFEKYCVQKAVDDIVASNSMNVRWYKAKHKLTKKVVAYVFEFIVYGNHNEIESGLEFTEMKYGKSEDIIIGSIQDLESPAEPLHKQMTIDDYEEIGA